MITYKNYYETIQSKGLNKTDLPMTLWKGWDFVNKVSLGGDSWTTYDSSEPIKRTVDLYFSKFEEFIASKKPDSKTTAKKKAPQKTEVVVETIEDTLMASSNVRQKMPKHQQATLVDEHISVVKRLEKELAAIPKMYSQDGKEKDETIVYAHYFYAQSDWFITEQNPKEDLFYGYTILNGDSQMSESGNLQISEFVKNGKVELDFHWKKKTLEAALYRADPDFFPAPKKAVTKTQVKPVAKRKEPNRTNKATRPSIKSNAKKVEALSVELKFLKRYVNLHNKEKTRSQIRLFISALQKAIRERKITKKSEFAKEITEIQSGLIMLHGGFENDTEKVIVKISEKRLAKILPVLGKQIQMQSVKFIKSYISLQGKLITNKQAHSLYTRIVRAYNAGKVTKRDKYWEELESIMEQLATFIQKNPNQGLLRIESRELNGLSGIVLGCPCDQDSLDGFDTIPERTIMNSMDIIKLNFKKLDFKGKWREFIGNPSKGFSAMIFAKPKMGKSYMSVDWAGYLANNHGTVLYVAQEEGIDETLQMKLREKAVMHPDLYVANYLPEDLSKYDFVFLDSITKLKLTPSDLAVMEANYPNISFISIFQVTKSGNFRGNNGFQHEVDVVIEIPEKGKAIQYGRFNQGGEMDVFDDMGD